MHEFARASNPSRKSGAPVNLNWYYFAEGYAIYILVYWVYQRFIRRRRPVFPLEWAGYLMLRYWQGNLDPLGTALPHVAYPGLSLICLDRLLRPGNDLTSPIYLHWGIITGYLHLFAPAMFEFEFKSFALVVAGFAGLLLVSTIMYFMRKDRVTPLRHYVPEDVFYRQRWHVRRAWVSLLIICFVADAFLLLPDPDQSTFERLVTLIILHGPFTRWGIGVLSMTMQIAENQSYDEINWEPGVDFPACEAQLREQHAVAEVVLERLRASLGPEIDVGIRREAHTAIDRLQQKLRDILERRPLGRLGDRHHQPYYVEMHEFLDNMNEITSKLETLCANFARDPGCVDMGPVELALDRLSHGIPRDGLLDADFITLGRDHAIHFRQNRHFITRIGLWCGLGTGLASNHVTSTTEMRQQLTTLREGLLSWTGVAWDSPNRWPDREPFEGFFALTWPTLRRILVRWPNDTIIQKEVLEIATFIVTNRNRQALTEFGHALLDDFTDTILVVMETHVASESSPLPETQPVEPPVQPPVPAQLAPPQPSLVVMRAFDFLCQLIAHQLLRPRGAERALRAAASALQRWPPAESQSLGTFVGQITTSKRSLLEVGGWTEQDMQTMIRVVTECIVPTCTKYPPWRNRFTFAALTAWNTRDPIAMEAAGLTRWMLHALHHLYASDEARDVARLELESGGPQRRVNYGAPMLLHVADVMNREVCYRRYVKEGVPLFMECLRNRVQLSEADTILRALCTYLTCRNSVISEAGRKELIPILCALMCQHAVEPIIEYLFEEPAQPGLRLCGASMIDWTFDHSDIESLIIRI